jgi:nucleotide-binding universal stress UspA family protein
MSPGWGRTPPVVVGIDAAGSADAAVDWASAEASARGCPLRIVHAFVPPMPAADPYGVMLPIDDLCTAHAAAELTLRDAVARARSVASDIDVSTRLRQGTPGRALLDEATGAQLLVLGNRGLCGLRGLLARSVSIQVAAHACCPVVVIRPSHGEDDSGCSPPRVVVGIDGTESCTPAIGFAFQAARQRGIRLTAVHAWAPDPPADLEGTSGPPAEAELQARRALERTLDGWRSKFPSIRSSPSSCAAIPLTCSSPDPMVPPCSSSGPEAEVTSWARCSARSANPSCTTATARSQSSATTPGGERTHPPEAPHIRSPNVIKSRSAREAADIGAHQGAVDGRRRAQPGYSPPCPERPGHGERSGDGDRPG